MTNITEYVDTALDVSAKIALINTTVDLTGYHMFFDPMQLTPDEVKAIVHRLMMYENYINAMGAV